MEINPLLCDPETGICEIPSNESIPAEIEITPETKPVSIVYFTDPICSSCWGIEPQLRKLKLAYGHLVAIEYRMGGLLPDWNYSSSSINKPSDVATHWDEVSHHYQMPIDGDVWLEDPLHSSYPPSIAFKAAQLQDPQLAIVFLRRIREMVFLEKKNITKPEYLHDAAVYAGLNVEQFQSDCQGKANDLFREDLALARTMGVRGFPSVFFSAPGMEKELVYGVQPYAVYEAKLSAFYPAVSPKAYNQSWNALFAKYPTLTTKEFAELSGQDWPAAEQQLAQLVNEQKLSKFTSKNGFLWKVI